MCLWDGTQALVHPCVHPHLQISMPETSWQIAIKIYMKHHLGGGLPAISFEADRMRTMVSMATHSSPRVIMAGKCYGNSSNSIFVWIFFLQW